MQNLLKDLPAIAKKKKDENTQYFKRLRRKPPKNLDAAMQKLHDDEFKVTDCLSCANCCKTTGPLFTDKDVHRIAKHLKLKPSQFEEQYLRKDEDGDLVLQNLPCSFLAPDNYCLLYAVRPKACREYPHTDRKKFHQISELTLKNVAICPATYNIVEKMKKEIPVGYKLKN